VLAVRCSLVWTRHCGVRPLTGLAAAALVAGAPSGCGSGDSTVAKTPQPTTTHPAAAPRTPAPPAASAPTSPPAPDPCAIDLAAPAIARAISELPRDPRSKQPWNPEPLAGNYNECAQLSAVIVKANTNAASPNTRAVMFHLGKLIPEGVPDTFGFNGLDTSQCTGDTVALSYSGGIGLPSVVKFRWNGNGVELIGNTGR
jgi:LppP/LprE lipoprotein